MLKKVLAVIAAFCVPAGALAATALVNVPGSPVYFTPDQIGAGLNYVINALNAQTITSNGNGNAVIPNAPIFTTMTGYIYANGVGVSTSSTTIPVSSLGSIAAYSVLCNSTSGSSTPTACTTLPSSLVIPGPTITGVANITGDINVSGNATQNSGFGSPPLYAATYHGMTAVSTTNPEVALMISGGSSVGYNAAPYTYYKEALGVFMTCNSGSASCWAANIAVGMGSGAGNIGAVGIETDLNLANQDYLSIPASATGPFAVAYAANGSGPHTATAGYLVTASVTNLFNYGYAIFDYASGSNSVVKTASYFDNGKAANSFYDTGTHNYGAYFGGTYSVGGIVVAGSGPGYAFATSGASFSVTEAGVLVAASLYTSGTLGAGNTTIAGYITVTPVAIASLPTCNSSTAGAHATVNNGVAPPTYWGTVSTTGAATDSVFCYYSGSAYSWVYD